MPHRLRIGLTTLCLILGAAPAWAGSAPPRAANGSEPAHGVRTLDLEERWRRGGEDDDLFFGLVAQAVADETGALYLLDVQLNEVYVLQADDGDFLRTIGRQGEGPGEFNRAGDLLRRSDGTIGVVQRFPGSVVLLTPDGVPAGTVLPGDPTTGGRDMLTGARAVGDDYVFSGGHMTRTDDGRKRRNFLALYSPDGVLRHEYLGQEDDFDFSARSFHETDGAFLGAGQWDVGPDGSVYAAAQRELYEITVFAPDGTVRLIVTRDYEPLARTADELDQLKRRWESGRRFQRFGTEQIFATTQPAVVRLEVRADGELWVLPSRGYVDQPPGVLQTWDVFTPAGVFDRQVALRGEGDGQRDRVLWLGDDTVLLIQGYVDARAALDGSGGEAEDSELLDATPMEVVSYAIR